MLLSSCKPNGARNILQALCKKKETRDIVSKTTVAVVQGCRSLSTALSVPSSNQIMSSSSSLYDKKNNSNKPMVSSRNNNYNTLSYQQPLSLSLSLSLWKQQNNKIQSSSIQQQQKRTIFIQTLDTPNPESIKFVPSGKMVLDTEDGNGYYVTRKDPSDNILRSPLAKDLFKVDGIKAVYLGEDFVTITKYAENHWKFLRPQLLDKLMTFFDKGQPALLEAPEINDTTILDDDDEVVAMIKELIEARIRPAVQEDGGDIHYHGFDEETGVVTVKLAGSCVGCPSSSVTLKQGVENMLMHYIPEVKLVQALEEEQDENDEAGDGEEELDNEDEKKLKTYEERLAAAGIPFSD